MTLEGKSTVFKLLLGLYSVDEGNILINDKNMNSYSKRQLRERISYIPQENGILTSNLYDYFKLGDMDVDKKELLNILGALSLLKELNIDGENIEKYDFGVGGKNLSTGQKQRLMVSKSMLKDSDIYLLDESTASVDSELETKIFMVLSEYRKDKSILSITHRLSTVKYMDRIIFIEDGKISGSGSHNDLYKSHERYKNFVDLQMIE